MALFITHAHFTFNSHLPSLGRYAVSSGSGTWQASAPRFLDRDLHGYVDWGKTAHFQVCVTLFRPPFMVDRSRQAGESFRSLGQRSPGFFSTT